jgi:hypothetical protein
MKPAVFLLAFLWATAATAEEQKNRSYFFNCGRDEECILIQGLCPGGVTALSRTYLKETLGLWKQKPELACQSAKPKTNDIKAWCVQNKCDAH